jgi:hypothetical protein
MEIIVQVGIGLVAIPWIGWVTASIFNQQREVALLKQIFEIMKERCFSDGCKTHKR